MARAIIIETRDLYLTRWIGWQIDLVLYPTEYRFTITGVDLRLPKYETSLSIRSASNTRHAGLVFNVNGIIDKLVHAQERQRIR